MKIDLRELDNITILDIKGEISILSDANELRQLLKSLLTDKKINVLINLKEVNYMDSSGLGVLISNFANFKKVNGSLKVMHIEGAVKRIFEFSKLDNFFEVYNSEEAALLSWK